MSSFPGHLQSTIEESLDLLVSQAKQHNVRSFEFRFDKELGTLSIRVPIPVLAEERRKELARLSEEGGVSETVWIRVPIPPSPKTEERAKTRGQRTPFSSSRHTVSFVSENLRAKMKMA
jgi:hypothetical protein